jgi:hypothetical protein
MKRVWVSRVVMFVANMEAEILRQSEQWQMKVFTRPGFVRGWRGESSVEGSSVVRRGEMMRGGGATSS